MGFHSYRGEFLKGYDRYAKAVSLTYLKSGSYRTGAGGICTIICFCLLSYWCLVNIFYALYNGGTFSSTIKTTLTQSADGNYPQYQMNQNEFLVSYDIIDISGELTSSAEIAQYVVGMWAQVNKDGSIKYFDSVKCTELFSEADKGNIFFQQIKYQYCPNTTDKIELQNFVQQKVDENNDMTYYFIVEYCSNLKSWHLPADTVCVDINLAQEKANDLLVQVKRMNQSFQPADNEKESFFYTERVTLSGTNANFNEYNIVQNSIKYHHNLIYTDQLLETFGASMTSYTTYSMEASSSSTLPFNDFGDQASWQSNTQSRLNRIAVGAQTGSPLVYKFTQSQQKQTSKFARLALYQVAQSFGSYLAFIIRFSMLMLAGWQKHSMDDSIIKKIYSAERIEDEDDSDDDEEHKKDDSTIDNTALIANTNKNEDHEEEDEKELHSAILERERFKYSYLRAWYLQRFTSPICCCCRTKPKRQDWLQRDAKSKLAGETDILEIIKKLRVHQFAAEVALKPSQRDMVSFFDDYKLKTEADRKKDDKRAEDQAKRGKTVTDDATQASGEILNLDQGVKSGKSTERILRSVMRVNNSKERTDKIIIDRITNKNPRPRTNVNILDFMDGVSGLKESGGNRSSNQQLFSIARQKGVHRGDSNRVGDSAINKKGEDDSFDEDFESEDFSDSD